MFEALAEKNMRKISIIGSGGSGKSTFAKQLATKLGITVYHLDSLYWKSGWIETDREEWVRLQQTLCIESEWIMDGNYGGTMGIRLNSADTIIFLDINRFLCLYRAFFRFIKYYGKTRPDMASGCNERLDFSFLKWIYNYPKDKKPGILKNLNNLDKSKKIYILKNQSEIEAFLNSAGRS